jgi:tRNA(fMet)-specific endonuclease VapC
MGGMRFSYMLDSNTIGNLIRNDAHVAERIASVNMASLCISSIVEGELHYGLAKRPEARRLALAVGEFLKRVETVPWNGNAARHYGELRAGLEKRGYVLSTMDMLIAAHALSLNLTPLSPATKLFNPSRDCLSKIGQKETQNNPYNLEDLLKIPVDVIHAPVPPDKTYKSSPCKTAPHFLPHLSHSTTRRWKDSQNGHDRVTVPTSSFLLLPSDLNHNNCCS